MCDSWEKGVGDKGSSGRGRVKSSFARNEMICEPSNVTKHLHNKPKPNRHWQKKYHTTSTYLEGLCCKASRNSAAKLGIWEHSTMKETWNPWLWLIWLSEWEKWKTCLTYLKFDLSIYDLSVVKLVTQTAALVGGKKEGLTYKSKGRLKYFWLRHIQLYIYDFRHSHYSWISGCHSVNKWGN